MQVLSSAKPKIFFPKNKKKKKISENFSFDRDEAFTSGKVIHQRVERLLAPNSAHAHSLTFSTATSANIFISHSLQKEFEAKLGARPCICGTFVSIFRMTRLEKVTIKKIFIHI